MSLNVKRCSNISYFHPVYISNTSCIHTALFIKENKPLDMFGSSPEGRCVCTVMIVNKSWMGSYKKISASYFNEYGVHGD